MNKYRKYSWKFHRQEWIWKQILRLLWRSKHGFPHNFIIKRYFFPDTVTWQFLVGMGGGGSGPQKMLCFPASDCTGCEIWRVSQSVYPWRTTFIFVDPNIINIIDFSQIILSLFSWEGGGGYNENNLEYCCYCCDNPNVQLDLHLSSSSLGLNFFISSFLTGLPWLTLFRPWRY